MHTRIPCITMALMGLLIASMSSCPTVEASGEISEINITPDCKRIAVRADGQIGSHSLSTLAKPNRLVLDIDGNGIGKEPTISGTIAAGVEVRAVRKGSGARVVMDFGHRPIPQHRVKTVGNYLLLFLEGWGVAAGASSIPPTETPAVSKPKQAPVLSSSADIQIKSAEVANGNIVLKVADQAHPERIYRIELGVDFNRLGFNTASIHPLTSFAKAGEVAPKPTLSMRQLPDQKVGPRKALVAPEEALAASPNFETQ